MSKSTTFNSPVTLTFTPLYEYDKIVAEEGGGATDNSSQWSRGDSSTGFIGEPIGDGWEIISMAFHADSGGLPNESMEVHLVDMRTPSASAPIIATVSITGSGEGVNDNAYVYQDMSSAPVIIPDGAVLGFRTGDEVGNWADMRVIVRMRRQIGQCVSSIQFAN